jgi:hypothetical protein
MGYKFFYKIGFYLAQYKKGFKSKIFRGVVMCYHEVAMTTPKYIFLK